MSTPGTPAAAGANAEQAFERLGQITRQLHEALNELGLAQGLREITQEFPGAVERLCHVGRMTEGAANKVLDLIDEADPLCDSFRSDSLAMAEAIERALRQALHRPSEVTDVMATAQMFSREAARFSEAQKQHLRNIMLAQDFQDLSGQVIKKVVDIITHTERQLLALLMETVPHLPAARPHSDLAGPQVPDKALKQGEVDALLDSLGF